MEYSEHQKLSAVNDSSQLLGEFLDWLGTQEMTVAYWVDKPIQSLAPVKLSTNELLARFFDIDLVKLEEEKRAMLNHLRTSQSGAKNIQ